MNIETRILNPDLEGQVIDMIDDLTEAELAERGPAKTRHDAIIVDGRYLTEHLSKNEELAAHAATVLVVADRETGASLRGAIRAGAKGYYVLPNETWALMDGIREAQERAEAEEAAAR